MSERDEILDAISRGLLTKQMRAILNAAGLELEEGQDALAAKFAGQVAAALESAGYVIVRREPDEAMIEAGCNAREANEPRDKNTTATWRAMIAAQEQKP